MLGDGDGDVGLGWYRRGEVGMGMGMEVVIKMKMRMRMIQKENASTADWAESPGAGSPLGLGKYFLRGRGGDLGFLRWREMGMEE